MIRTPREWTETCPTCKGKGEVHQKERFALWTPEEHPNQKLKAPPPGAPADAYCCTTSPGASVWEACTEGIGLAQKVNRPVVFTINGTMIVCRADSNAEKLVDEWAKRRE